MKNNSKNIGSLPLVDSKDIEKFNKYSHKEKAQYLASRFNCTHDKALYMLSGYKVRTLKNKEPTYKIIYGY